MRIIRPADHVPMPWKNGGGMTTQIAIFPDNSSVSAGNFDWRVSVADVIADGPFSAFPGYDRFILLLSGGGMTLSGGDQELDLRNPHVVRRFPGEWDVDAHLIAGPVHDFNVMVRRAAITAAVTVDAFSESRLFRAAGAGQLAYMIEGTATAGGHVLDDGAAIILAAGEPLTIKPLGETVRMVWARFETAR